MSNDNLEKQHDLYLSVKASDDALDKMTAKERRDVPTGTYGRAYNTLIDQVAKLHPELNELIPPKVEISQNQFGHHVVIARYVEMHSYYKRLRELLYARL